MSAIPPKKRHYITVPITGCYYVHVDEEADVDVETLDKETLEQLVEALEAKGWRCIPPPIQGAPPDMEYRLWEALHFGRDEEAKRVAAELVYDRLGRIV
jgi:hypothetical protein